ncbi:NUDIX hydrolase [Peribacillus sp. SCS-26]|uniref:NUDIX hydrolase n=1 Tax=Paraperibacillus marinus TaxID=3115295 RepID=UPI0039067D0A
METELLRTFDNKGRPLGTADRSEVHKAGLWHEAFHCWLVSYEKDRHYIFLQKRSERKKDYPGLYDITAAGHLLAHETIEDGVREVREELGIKTELADLVPMGFIKYEVIKEERGFIDREIAYQYLYEGDFPYACFKLQREEVSGMVKAEWNSFYEFCTGMQDSFYAEGFEEDEEGTRREVSKNLGRAELVSHDPSFYQVVAGLIRNHLKTRS